jgi:UDP-N-acetyl-D-galactosamine dehydrogenase
MPRKVAVIGLGYVGLPVALAFSRKLRGVVGFDINEKKVQELRSGLDATGEIPRSELLHASIKFTSELDDLRSSDFFIIAVPTPVDQNRQPDLSALKGASEIVGRVISSGAIVVFESTVYPGVTEEFCGPIIEQVSGLKRGEGFFLGYSPERINPGDKEHTLERIVKVVSGENPEVLNIIASTYAEVVSAGVYRAQSIKVAEAAKVIENTQRDLNIALMNELALIFERIGIRTKDVLEAAGTKWNFLRFSPGLVGGHCIGVDPYYLTTKAESLGYHPQVITAGRRINDGMGAYVANRLVKVLFQRGMREPRIGVLGVTFKENVSDTRNSRVPDIVAELKSFGLETVVSDPLATKQEVEREYGISLDGIESFRDLDGLVLAVTHAEYLELGSENLQGMLKPGGVFFDIKSQFSPGDFREDILYLSL